MTRFVALALLAALLAPATLAQTRSPEAPFHDPSGARGVAEAVAEAGGSPALAGVVTAVLTEDQKLTASDPVQSDQFGSAVSISGDRALVGSGLYGEVAYVFEFDGTQWAETHTLTASDAGGYFGSSVSLSGDRALVGAFGNDCTAGVDCGAAYVFDFDGSTWNETAKLTASDAAADDYFGLSVSLSGDRALVGASYDDCTAGMECGAAYVFDFGGSSWTETATLTASDAVANDIFGGSVSLSGDRALVGASGACESVSQSGAAYVFDFDGSSWTETAILTASDAAARFGGSVSLSGSRALVGASGDACGSGTQSGAAYVFDFDGSLWTETRLIASGAVAGDLFGASVSLSGDRVLASASRADCVAGEWCGAAYVFDFDGAAWNETAALTASDAAPYDLFGSSVSLSGDRAFVGATQYDCGEILACGAVYTFDFAEGPPEPTVPDVDIAYISSTSDPQRGDHVFIRARATNHETTTVQTRVYFDVLYPDDSDHTYSVLSKPFPGETSVQIQKIKKIKFRLPANAPAGEYLVTLFAADDLSSGGMIYDMDSFTFTLPPIDFVAPEASGALLSVDGSVPQASGPNPFTDRTTIRYELASAADVELRVFDARGREVAALARGVQMAGEHGAVLRAGSLPSGVYLWRLTASGAVTTGTVTLVR